MKKKFFILFVFSLFVISCQNSSRFHTHTFSSEWYYDNTYHWHEATCEHTNEISAKARHSFGSYTSNNDATYSKDGTKSRFCTICNYEDTVIDEGSMKHNVVYSLQTYSTYVTVNAQYLQPNTLYDIFVTGTQQSQSVPRIESSICAKGSAFSDSLGNLSTSIPHNWTGVYPHFTTAYFTIVQ